MEKRNNTYLVLHNIRSVHNIGAIFRTADAIGINRIYLSGYSPTPVDRFGRARNDLHKTALGAEKTVPWEHFTKIGDLFRRLQRDQIVIVAVEQTNTAADYKKFKVASNTAFVFGNEVQGLSKTILKKCNSTIFISMKGKKESLNVATSVGIVLFRVLDN